MVANHLITTHAGTGLSVTGETLPHNCFAGAAAGKMDIMATPPRPRVLLESLSSASTIYADQLPPPPAPTRLGTVPLQQVLLALRPCKCVLCDRVQDGLQLED